MATVTVVAAPISVEIQPSAATVYYDETEGFTATVRGTTDQRVTWSVEEGAAGGTIDAQGVYKAPGEQAVGNSYHVVAKSQADPNEYDTAVVTIDTRFL
jgi:chitinase